MLGGSQGRAHRLRRALPVVFACFTLFAACGGESQRHSEGVGGTGGDTTGTGGSMPGAGGQMGGSGPAAGKGGSGPVAGGAGGVPARGCPSIAPRAFIDGACPTELPADGCSYTLECSGGPRELSYQCAASRVPDRFEWSAQGPACDDRPYEFCWGGDAQVRCGGGSWQLMGWGGDPPPDCPTVPPVEASDCRFSIYSGPPTCGYPCPDGSGWTVTSCFGTSAGSVWLNDGACPGDCGSFEIALRDFLLANNECEKDAECTVMDSPCALSEEHCSGAFGVSKSADPEEFSELSGALADCALQNEGWSCASCDALPPAPRCVNGRCSVAP